MKHVLIMEDNTILANQWQDAFERNDCEVTLSHCGEDAIAHLEKTSFDLVITDMVVPGKKGGLQVIGKVQIMKTGAPPVIAVSGANRHKDAETGDNFFLDQASHFGVTETLEKPFSTEELLRKAQDVWARYD